MKVLDRLRKPAESALTGALSDLLKFVATAAAGWILSIVLARIPALGGTLWTAKTLSNAEVALWLVTTVIAAVWITLSVMRRRIARMEAIALQREQDALELSLLDPATGLFNLRALNKRLPEALASARKANEPLTMVLFDIDGFGAVNAMVGHDHANTILKKVADLLNPRAPDEVFRYPENVTSNSRVVFRYGGDEFIILAFNTTVTGGIDPTTGKKVNYGLVMAEKLQLNVWNGDFPSLTARRRERHLPEKLTISAGIADSHPSRDPNDTPETLTRRAELALIAAKKRNMAAQLDDNFRGAIVAYSVELQPDSD